MISVSEYVNTDLVKLPMIFTNSLVALWNLLGSHFGFVLLGVTLSVSMTWYLLFTIRLSGGNSN